MQKLLNNLKKKRGFTLVEVIVVLIIIAILAAILLPSLTGYIDKANDKAAIAECRSAVIASQTLLSEAYGAKTFPGVVTVDNIYALSELSTDNHVVLTGTKGGKITSLVYYGTRMVTYQAGKYTTAALPDSVPASSVAIS